MKVTPKQLKLFRVHRELMERPTEKPRRKMPSARIMFEAAESLIPNTAKFKRYTGEYNYCVIRWNGYDYSSNRAFGYPLWEFADNFLTDLQLYYGDLYRQLEIAWREDEIRIHQHEIKFLKTELERMEKEQVNVQQ